MKKLQVLIKDDDYELLTQVATYERLSYSSWTRRIISQALRRAKQSLPDVGEKGENA